MKLAETGEENRCALRSIEKMGFCTGLQINNKNIEHKRGSIGSGSIRH